MKIPLTGYGLRELILFPTLLLAAGIVSWFAWSAGRPWCQIAAAILGLGVLAFFRDPPRQVLNDQDVLLAPADGIITDICEVEEPEFIKGSARRIGIFLSVLDVHINRTPCDGVVEYIRAHPGKCYNALRTRLASEKNKANCVGLHCPDHPAGMVMVKQITGVIARRIVCRCKPGDMLSAGERFGMIKFGSRTELFLPEDGRAQIMVKKGDKVRAGTTILVHYGSTKSQNGPLTTNPEVKTKVMQNRG
ncbi:MAG: hypothetical protein AMJ79_02735 [Phycisphaerae bacterium SM23_30]|nr:MAG: hypothetical protein AMJ79_02735 [Phycisphaerae bacterium SM23_30]